MPSADLRCEGVLRMGRESDDLHAVVMGLLDDVRLQTACAGRNMGALFRLINHRGISTRRLAAAVEISQGRLYDYMNDKRRVEKLALFEQIADALHIPGHLLGLARREWEPQINNPRTPMVSSPDRSYLATMEVFRAADKQSGGGRLYGAVVQYLGDHVARRLVDAGAGPDVFTATAALTEMAGWMAHDSGRDDLAEAHFTCALRFANTAEDMPLAADVSASSSHLSLQRGDPVQAANWALAGLGVVKRGYGVPTLTARLHSMYARALAASDQRAEALCALNRAHQALGLVSGTAHPWVSPFDAASLASEAALVFRDVGMFGEALEHADQAVSLREDGRTRSLAMSRITLVGIHACRNDLDAVTHYGEDLLATPPSLCSVRVVNQLRGLCGVLDRHRSYRPIRDFLSRVDETSRIRAVLLADVMNPLSEGGSA